MLQNLVFTTESAENLQCYTFITSDGKVLFTEHVSFSNQPISASDSDLVFMWDLQRSPTQENLDVTCAQLQINQTSQNLIAQNQAEVTLPEFQNTTVQTYSVNISLPKVLLNQRLTVPISPVQFFALEDQTTYEDWITFTVDTRSQNLRCFDTVLQLYLETKVGITEVTCSFAKQIQLRLGGSSVSNTVKVTRVRFPIVEDIIPNSLYRSDAIKFAVSKDPLDYRIWSCNILIENQSVYSSQSCSFDLNFSLGVYKALLYLSTADGKYKTEQTPFLIVQTGSDLDMYNNSWLSLQTSVVGKTFNLPKQIIPVDLRLKLSCFLPS